MRAMYRFISSLYCLTVCVLTSHVDHDTYVKQVHLHDLGIQVQHMHEKMYEQCPKLFQTSDSASSAIIGRRQSLDAAALDLKIELAEKALADLIQTFVNCTSAKRPQMTSLTHTVKSTSASLTKESTLTTSTSTAATTTPLYTTAKGEFHPIWNLHRVLPTHRI